MLRFASLALGPGSRSARLRLAALVRDTRAATGRPPAARRPEQIDMMLFRRRLSSPPLDRWFKVGSVMAAAVVVRRIESSSSSMSANLLIVGVAPFGAFAVATFGSFAAAAAI